ncbi:hypothetical protein IscW_ISCW009333 [Ixodes scapularis]|uniref:Uncharacterized protein n=1 Tax=Ixodes scapularis TaxID=6945 RepID=B7Q204_IXOSC|nr:hypothetical protein IscW_ISCW009333 [Ixodes scapularis]|eukprot:XP_002410306.1 hypothetical protein IscW_ISCW009333 [Ixodes scapularis]
MALQRLLWYLENEAKILHHRQVGFGHGLGTQYVFLLLRHQVLDPHSKVQNRTLVAVDAH